MRCLTQIFKERPQLIGEPVASSQRQPEILVYREEKERDVLLDIYVHGDIHNEKNLLTEWALL